ncbi:MAG: DUF1801 domain-containing protein [Bacteroidota bacterium]
MATARNIQSNDVTTFLNDLKLPLRKEIDELRDIILSSDNKLSENIKWNGPNYSVGDHDRVTMRVQPPKQIQLILHRGAKVVKEPKGKLIDDSSDLLEWKGNDRAVITFKTMDEIKASKKDLARHCQEVVESFGVITVVARETL